MIAVAAMPEIRPIGRLSKETGCHIETIRYYERIGVVPRPPRGANGYRQYGADHVKRLAFVRRARELGFTLDEVRTLIRLAEDRSQSCTGAYELALHHLADVRAKLADLRKMGRILSRMVTACAGGKLVDCPILESLAGAGTKTEKSAVSR